MIVSTQEQANNIELLMPAVKAALDKGLSYQVAKSDFTIALMIEALKRSNGVITQAALLLGVNSNWASQLIAKGRLHHLVAWRNPEHKKQA